MSRWAQVRGTRAANKRHSKNKSLPEINQQTTGAYKERMLALLCKILGVEPHQAFRSDAKARVCTHACMYECVYVPVYLHTQVHTCIYICACMRTNIHIHIHIITHIRACRICAYIIQCMRTGGWYIRVYKHTCTHTYICY